MAKEKVIIPCKRCGSKANADDFVIDPYYGLMVCPNCVKERRQKAEVHKELSKGKIKKTEPNEKAESKQGRDLADKSMKKCYKCKYNFLYNDESKTPRLCPFCGAEVLDF